MTYEENEVLSGDKEKEDQTKEESELAGKAEKRIFKCLVQPMEFMLGLGDVGGEVMRRCITSLGGGDIETCFHINTFLQALYTG